MQLTENFQSGLTGPHVQNPSIVYKAFQSERVLALIHLQQMAEMTVWDCQWRIKIVPLKQMDVQVRYSYFEKDCRKKVHATILKGILGGFEFTSTVLQRRLKE